MSDCVFCNLKPTDTIVARNETMFALVDIYPLADGHVLIAPWRHVGSFFDLGCSELEDMLRLMPAVRDHIGDCDGYNLGVNDGPAAGQTVAHMHLHVIPRRFGDVPNPRGGIRRIFPADVYSERRP